MMSELKNLFVGKYKPIDPPNKISKSIKKYIEYIKEKYQLETDIQYICYNCTNYNIKMLGKVCVGFNKVKSYENELSIPVIGVCPVCNGTGKISKNKLAAFHEKEYNNYKKDYINFKSELKYFESILRKLSLKEQKFLYKLISRL